MNNSSDLSATFKRLLSYMGRHAKSFMIVGILVSISGLASLAGTYMIKPVVNLAMEKDVSLLVKSIIFMGLIYLCGVLSTYGYTQTMVKAAQQVIYDIRRDLFAHMQSLPLRVFDSNSQGDLMARFTSDVDVLSDALNNSFAMLIQSFIQAAGTLVMLFILNWKLSLLVAIFYLIMIIYIQRSSKKNHHYFAKWQRHLGKLSGFSQEMLGGLKVVKVFNHEQASLQDFKEQNAALQKENEKAVFYSNLMVPLVVSLSYVNYALVALAGGYLCLKNEMSVGSLASYLVFVRQAAMPINQVTGSVNMLLSAMAGAGRIFAFMDEPSEQDEGIITLAYGKQENGVWKESKDFTGSWVWKHPRKSGFEYVPLQGDVRLNNVSFSYVSNRPVLSNITLYANPGQKIAIVGSTGAGKTTLASLLPRFYDVNEGQVTFDGLDLQLIKKADLRRSMAIVLQDTHLFTGTIMDNIRYGNLQASDEACIEAAKLANAHSFIERLPDGYNTYLKADGSSLSNGQRQLLAIARAALADPAVLILDEATSNIDTRTEHLVQKGMDQLMQGRTTFVIAHRLSTIQSADLIIVMEHGQIKERGTHEQLLKKQGMYANLYQGKFELS
jgi:ATP-binding cassette subfamily B protein